MFLRKAGPAAMLAVLTSLALLPGTSAAATDPLRADQWNLDAVHADVAHRTSIGSGVLVAVVDTGVDAGHGDLAGAVTAQRDVIDGDQSAADATGHGTHVAGIIAAKANNGAGITGAAPGAKLLAIRVFDASNRSNTDQVAAGVDAAVAAGAQVVNLSVSTPLAELPTILPGNDLVVALERAAAAGVVVVAAAGNNGAPLCAQPLVTTKLLCVGAVTRARKRAPYSNYGLRVDMVAPGGTQTEGVLSTRVGGGYETRSGTSQAAPHVAAAAALLVDLGLRGDAVIDRLKQTAADVGDPAGTGSGLLDMGAAVAGLGPELAPAAAGAGTLSAKTTKRVGRSTARRQGISVGCLASEPGRCTLRVTSGGRLLARGSTKVTAGVRTTVRAKLTVAGRRSLKPGPSLRPLLRVSTPGARSVRLRTTILR